MKMAKPNPELLSKFRGCLLGSLIGDCFGAPFEGEESAGAKVVIRKYFDTLEDPQFKGPVKCYTDDTAMTKSVAKCLIDKPEIDFKFMARLFVTEYFLEPHRGYGSNVVTVFRKLKLNKFADIYTPARDQFGGYGSLGNGGAMRIAPIALYYCNDYNKMVDVAVKGTEITHSNPLGIHGAVLQCIAIQQSLLHNPLEKLNPKQFLSQLSNKIKTIESKEQDELDEGLEEDVGSYHDKLLFIENLLDRKYEEGELDDEVVENLGNSVSAFESVPTAVYCFLKSYVESPKLDTLFRRTVEYAISLGGDTDTIASMAGAIAGSYVGEEHINQQFIRHCENHDKIRELADNLYNAYQK